MKMIGKTALAMIMAVIMLGAVVVSTPSASASGKIVDVVETQKLDFAYDVPPEMLEEVAMAFPCLIPYFEDLEGGCVSVVVDGMVHINLKAWEKHGCLDIKLQAFWHGTVSVMIDDEEVLCLDVKNLQIVAHVKICDCGCPEHLLINVHLNGEMTSEMLDLDLDLKAHLIVHYVNGELMLKLWLPEFLGLPIFDL